MVDLYKHRDRVFSFFKSRGFLEEDARDLTQETFLRALRRIRTLRSTDPLSWICRIAANVWKNEVRDRKTLKRDGTRISLEELTQGVDAGELTALEPRDTPSALDRLITAERLAVTQRCLEALPQTTRQCLRLYAKGLKYKEIACILQIPINTVKTNIHDGRSALKQCVEKLFGGGPDAIP